MWFHFRVLLSKEDNPEKVIERGVLQAECYADVADCIDTYYGDTLKRIELLEPITDSYALIFGTEEEYVLDRIRDNWMQNRNNK